jgi:hypothetical protein
MPLKHQPSVSPRGLRRTSPERTVKPAAPASAANRGGRSYCALLKEPEARLRHTVLIKAKDDAWAIKQGRMLALYFEVALWDRERLVKWWPQQKES